MKFKYNICRIRYECAFNVKICSLLNSLLRCKNCILSNSVDENFNIKDTVIGKTFARRYFRRKICIFKTHTKESLKIYLFYITKVFRRISDVHLEAQSLIWTKSISLFYFRTRFEICAVINSTVVPKYKNVVLIEDYSSRNC